MPQTLWQVYHPSTPTKAITPTSPYIPNETLPPHKPETMWSTLTIYTDNSTPTLTIYTNNSAPTYLTHKSNTPPLPINVRLCHQTSRLVTRPSSDQTISALLDCQKSSLRSFCWISTVDIRHMHGPQHQLSTWPQFTQLQSTLHIPFFVLLFHSRYLYKRPVDRIVTVRYRISYC